MDCCQRRQPICSQMKRNFFSIHSHLSSGICMCNDSVKTVGFTLLLHWTWWSEEIHSTWLIDHWNMEMYHYDLNIIYIFVVVVFTFSLIAGISSWCSFIVWVIHWSPTIVHRTTASCSACIHSNRKIKYKLLYWCDLTNLPLIYLSILVLWVFRPNDHRSIDQSRTLQPARERESWRARELDSLRANLIVCIFQITLTINTEKKP